jgi:hypothetical protein
MGLIIASYAARKLMFIAAGGGKTPETMQLPKVISFRKAPKTQISPTPPWAKGGKLLNSSKKSPFGKGGFKQ